MVGAERSRRRSASGEYQVRDAKSMQRHWILVFTAYTFVLWHQLTGGVRRRWETLPLLTISETLAAFRTAVEFRLVRWLQCLCRRFCRSQSQVWPRLGLEVSKVPLAIEAPAVVIVEAKKSDIKSGIGQCIAEMVAAQRFNEAKGKPISPIYGTSAFDDFSDTVNVFDGDGGSGALSAFGTRNPIYYLGDGAGIGLRQQLVQ